MVEIIEKRPGPLRIKFNPKRTPINLSEVDYQFIEKYHVNIWNLGTHEFRYDFTIFFICMNSYMNS